MIFLDFETRGALDLKKVGMFKYAASAYPTMLCWAKDSGDVNTWRPGDPNPDFPKDEIYVAHNADFDRLFFERLFGERDFFCTMKFAAELSLPRGLDELSKHYQLGGKANVDFYLSDEKEIEQYCRLDVMLCRSVFYEMTQFARVNSGRQLCDIIMVQKLDFDINNRGVLVDIERVKKVIAHKNLIEKNLDQKIYDLTDGAANTAKEVKRIVEFCRRHGVLTNSIDKEQIKELLDKEKVLPAKVREVLEIREQIGISSLAKCQAMLDMEVEGRIKGNFIYAKAETRRWAGAGVQLQNLPRYKEPDAEMQDKYPLKALSMKLRSLFVPKKGHVFLVSDFSQIETRLLFWLAGESAALKDLAEGKDIYKELASNIFQMPVNEITPEQRFVGKTAILGCGYGMGADHYFEMNKKNISDRSIAQTAVNKYRQKFGGVVSLWSSLESQFKRVLAGGESVIFQLVASDVVVCNLPSFRQKYYHNVKLSKGSGFTTEIHKDGKKLYGGLLAENIVSGCARDLLLDALINCEKEGLKTVIHVHDEIVIECPEDEAAEQSAKLKGIMSKHEGWAKGVPIACELEIKPHFV